MDDTFKLVTASVDGVTENYVTMIDPEVVFERGLQPELIVGKLQTSIADGGQLEPENFLPNVSFVDFLHEFVANSACKDSGLVEAAESGRFEHLFVVDQRTASPAGEVPPEDIIGAFAVKDGKISAETYESNRGQHKLLTDKGFFNLGEGAMASLREAQMRQVGE